MRGDPASFTIKTAGSLAEALSLLAAAPGEWTLLGGGTDLMVLYEAGLLPPRRMLSLHALTELRKIAVHGDYVDIGAMTTYAQLRADPVLAAEFPCIGRAAAETGGLAIQNRGTIGGNIANASPAADTPPALLVYEAQLELVSAAGSRWVEYKDFHLGYKRHLLQPAELIRTVRLRRGGDAGLHFYRKVGTRRAQAISKVVLAAHGTKAGGKVTAARIAVGSVAPLTLRCRRVEDTVRGSDLNDAAIDHACAELAAEIAPIDDVRSTGAYRGLVAGRVLRQFLEELRAHP
jgi:CO/xanthine dehydrogenase FAD-binding subunit